MEQEKQKGTWGGSRPGAGRKKKSKLTHKCTFKISEESWHLLQSLDNKAAFVDRVIRHTLSGM